ncbi:cytochrome P450 [Streptomyces sp. NPDC058623]|uniref:cytochrome P450 n=1 Tax=Streptomyces sp. NPDC058623 TaxID=3346563 RepID=UPI00365A689E
MAELGHGQMRNYHGTMLAMADRLITRWDRCAGAEQVDVLADMIRLAMDTIGQCGFGYGFGSFERPELHPVITTLLRAMVHARNLDTREPGTDHLYEAEDRQYVEDTAFPAGHVDEVIRARLDAGDTRADVLLGLTLNAPHTASGERLSPRNIRNQVIIFLIAGHETTAGLLTFALHNLAEHPEVLARATSEVDALWGDQPYPRPGFDEVGRLRYVRQILNESLRLWPIAPMFSRVAYEDTLLGGTYPTKKGQAVRVLIPMLHREPEWGEDPEGARASSAALRKATVRSGRGRARVWGARGDPRSEARILAAGVFRSPAGVVGVRDEEEVVWRTPNTPRRSRIEEDAAGWKRTDMSDPSVSSQVRRITGLGSSPTRPTWHPPGRIVLTWVYVFCVCALCATLTARRCGERRRASCGTHVRS